MDFKTVDREPRVGDVFPSKAPGSFGYKEGTRYWLLIAITPRGSHVMLGLNDNWDIVSASRYGSNVMRERRRLFSIKTVDVFVCRLHESRHEYYHGMTSNAKA